MKEEVVTFASMQGDHRRWDYDHSSWRSDIEHWRSEHELALSQLASLQEIILQHGETSNIKIPWTAWELTKFPSLPDHPSPVLGVQRRSQLPKR